MYLKTSKPVEKVSADGDADCTIDHDYANCYDAKIINNDMSAIFFECADSDKFMAYVPKDGVSYDDVRVYKLITYNGSERYIESWNDSLKFAALQIYSDSIK